MKSFNEMVLWRVWSFTVNGSSSTYAAYAGCNLSIPFQLGAAIPAIPVASTSSSDPTSRSVGTRSNRPCSAAATTSPGNGRLRRLPKKWRNPKSWGYPAPSNSWWLSKHFKTTSLKRSSSKPPCNSQELDSAGCTTNPPHRRETSSNAARNTSRELGKRWSVAHDLPLQFTAPQYWDVWISKAKGFKSNKRRSS